MHGSLGAAMGAAQTSDGSSLRAQRVGQRREHRMEWPQLWGSGPQGLPPTMVRSWVRRMQRGTENQGGGGLMSGQQQQADLVGGKGTLAEGGGWDGGSGPGGWVLAQGEGTSLSLHRVLDRARMYGRHLTGPGGQR